MTRNEFKALDFKARFLAIKFAPFEALSERRRWFAELRAEERAAEAQASWQAAEDAANAAEAALYL